MLGLLLKDPLALLELALELVRQACYQHCPAPHGPGADVHCSDHRAATKLFHTALHLYQHVPQCGTPIHFCLLVCSVIIRHDLLCKVQVLLGHDDDGNCRQSVQNICHSCLEKGVGYKKHMPLYYTVCKNPSAALPEIKSSACRLPGCTLTVLACLVSSSALTLRNIASDHSAGTGTCNMSQVFAFLQETAGRLNSCLSKMTSEA